MKNKEIHLKRCSSCKAEKSRDDFHKNRHAKDGLEWQCKKCTSEREREYREANLEKRREREREYREANPEKRREALRKWKKANPEKVREAVRKASIKRRQIEAADNFFLMVGAAEQIQKAAIEISQE